MPCMRIRAAVALRHYRVAAGLGGDRFTAHVLSIHKCFEPRAGSIFADRFGSTESRLVGRLRTQHCGDPEPSAASSTVKVKGWDGWSGSVMVPTQSPLRPMYSTGKHVK